MRLSEFDYFLPRDRIAQQPLESRDDSRLLLLSRHTGILADSWTRDLPGVLEGNELLVVNNARVLPARLFGRRTRGGAKGIRGFSDARGGELSDELELLLARRISADEWDALVRPGRKLPVGAALAFGEGELRAEIIGRGEGGIRRVKFSSVKDVDSVLDRLGHVPLPPYINRGDVAADRVRYQTIFATQPGAVAAPTAGLHFTRELVDRIKARGVKFAEITLDVGLGTFQPIRGERVEDHKIHSESYEISDAAAAAICNARRAGRPIVAVGTTVVRALEDAALKAGADSNARRKADGLLIRTGWSEANIFIYPGHKFRVVDGLLTNFHLPRSTLLVLVSAFAGRERILEAYSHAVDVGYRFYSYGDCMLIR